MGPQTLRIMQAVSAIDPDPASCLLVACSGGADSLALAAAARLATSHTGLATHAIVIDHGLQDGSAEVATRVENQLHRMGYRHVRRVAVTVHDRGTGPEAAAREARYNALSEAAEELDAVVLLGHTMDDQAETVLLGLARGSGTRSLAGMPAARGRFRRPLLEIRRAQTIAACGELGLVPWRDPHNTDPAFARVRVRDRVLPMLAEELTPGVVEALARTARLATADADLLDHLAAEAHREVTLGDDLDVAGLGARPDAIRHRVLLRWMRHRGGRNLNQGHVLAVDHLLTGWRGQQGVDVPGMRVMRRAGRLSAVAG